MAVRSLFLLLLLTGCGVRYTQPEHPVHDARFGYLAERGSISKNACFDWDGAITDRDPFAGSHVSYPESNPTASCFTRVLHQGELVSFDPIPSGCEFPGNATDAEHRKNEALERELYACDLSPRERAASVQHNTRVLKRLEALRASPEQYPYAAIIVPGHGLPSQNDASILSFIPGDSCAKLDDADLPRFGSMVQRSTRAAQSLRGKVAPIAIVTGGRVHSKLVEAFAMLHLLTCRLGIPEDAVLLEPCADHTHTNLRNAARWLDAIGGRAAYLVTDDHIQSEYFQDWNVFDLIGGSIDQRSIRDFGYIIGSWRQASVGNSAGFWFTPYRFWADPPNALGRFTCVNALPK